MLLIAAKVLHVLLYTGVTVGCALILYAGYREGRGELEAARRIARIGGFTMAGSALATVASWPVLLALLPDSTRHVLLEVSTRATLILVLGAGLTLLAGFIGLLAGLSGKPRPSGYIAAILYALGAVSLLVVILKPG